ncbi:MAG: Pr6Pr family membrane protein [Acidimicrobiia bacterium]
MSETTHRALRLALASLLLVGLVSQLFIGLSRSDLTVVRFFSYFTVLSNTLAVIMLTLLAAAPGRDDTRWFALFRGAVTIYMSVTALVYAVLLAPNLADVAVPEPWIDWTIHVIGPVAVAVDWFVSPPSAPIENSALAIWLLFPAVYLGYSLIRGSMVDWYPYPFLNPDEVGGYAGVALWSTVGLVVVLGFGYLYRWWVNRVVGRAEPAPA